MADDSCDICTFSYSVPLPIDDSSPPSTVFTVTFSCNGVTYTSDEYFTADEALAWADESLSDFGTWSLAGNTLILEGSLCEVASLTTQSYGNPIVDDTGNELRLDSTTTQSITDVWGISAVDVSVKGQKASNSSWRTKVAALGGLFVEPITGSTSQWALYKSSGSDGYNIVLSEVNTRGQNINTLLGGVGAKTYGYGFFEDALAYIKLLSPKPSITVSFDLIRPVLNGTYVGIEAEIAYVVTACAAQTVTIRDFQLCYELGLSSNNDVFSAASDISTATQTLVTYIETHYPTIAISIDANNADDTTLNFLTLNALQNAVTDVDYVRQYFQFDATLTTYESNLNRVKQLSSLLIKFQAQFTNGQKVRLAQSILKGGNPFKDKVGAGLIYANLFINVINENIARSNLIVDYVQYNINNLVKDDATLYAAYYFLLLIRGAMQNNGKISYTTNGADTSNLIIFPVKKGSNSETYIINNSSDFISFDKVYLNSAQKNVTVESYFGDPSSDTATHYTDGGTTVLLYPHSLTKIVTI